MRVLLDGLHFAEGPRWRDGLLWFSDLHRGQDAGCVMTLDEDGNARTILDQVPGGPPSGLGWLPDGRLLLAATVGRTLYALNPDGTVSTHADLSGVVTQDINDMVVDAAGVSYVGSCDIPGMPAPALSELIIVRPDGRAEVADPAMRFPNGSVITADGRTLIVAETFGACLTAYTITGDKTLVDRRVWAELPGMFPDGICLDDAGAVWLADAAGKQCVRVVEGGEVTDRVATDLNCYACALGGADGRTLFMLTGVLRGRSETPPGQIVAHRVDVPGGGSP
jgi:sugar lactone lactonase YvrE